MGRLDEIEKRHPAAGSTPDLIRTDIEWLLARLREAKTLLGECFDAIDNPDRPVSQSVTTFLAKLEASDDEKRRDSGS